MAGNRIPRRTLAGLMLGTLVVAGGLAAAIAMLFRTTDRDPREVVMAAQRVLRERFAPAADIRFAPVNGIHVESQGEGRYLVTGWMQITNQEGEKAIFDFSCVMLTVPGGQWVSETVEVVPRP
jgi:hypothetical protein